MMDTKGDDEQVKSVFLDIDGTLINPEHVLTEKNILAITELVEDYSLPVHLVSARPPCGMREYYDELKLRTPFTAYNGAISGKFLEGFGFEAIRNLMIPSELVPDLHKESNAFSFTFCIYEGNTLYVKNVKDVHALKEERLTHCVLKVLDLEAKMEEWKFKNTGPHKIQCIGEFEEIKPYVEILKKKEYASKLHMNRSGHLNFEITHFQATKENAVRYLSEEDKIPLSAVMAIGDNYNDVATLNMVGFGIAMGNAPQDILNEVKLHTSPNTDNGVANALIQYFPKLSRNS